MVDLRAKFDNHVKRNGSRCTLRKTKNALINQTKEKLVVAGLDSSLIGSLSKKLLHVYHSALVSMPDHLLRKCNPTNAPCEASETSVRNMILCICCILNMWSYVCTEIDLVPSEFYFNAKKGVIWMHHGLSINCKIA